MSFTFTPMTDEQLNEGRPMKEFNLLPEGVYVFYIKSAEEKTASTGNPMISLVLCINDQDGFERQIFDNLVSTPKAIYKIKQFCDAVGLDEKYNAGSFCSDDCVNKNGKAKINIQKGEPKGDGSYYKDKNVVKSYIKTAQNDSIVQVKKAANAETFSINDDIPF